MSPLAVAPLWACDRCGRSFANRNQAHNCLRLTVEQHLADKTDLAVAIYREVHQALSRHGDFREHAQKGGIGFITRMTFAGVALKARWVDLFFLLPQPLDHPRVRKLDLFGPTSWGHSVRLRSLEDVDDEVSGWLGESLKRGNQETLDSTAEVQPLSASQLAILWTGFRGKCLTKGGDQVIRLPGYVADALGMTDLVTARIAGVTRPSSVLRDAGSALVPVDPALGLGEDDETDVFITGGPA